MLQFLGGGRNAPFQVLQNLMGFFAQPLLFAWGRGLQLASAGEIRDTHTMLNCGPVNFHHTKAGIHVSDHLLARLAPDEKFEHFEFQGVEPTYKMVVQTAGLNLTQISSAACSSFTSR